MQTLCKVCTENGLLLCALDRALSAWVVLHVHGDLCAKQAAVCLHCTPPLCCAVDTPMWAESSNAFHAIIARAADVMSGSTACSKTIRAGLDMWVVQLCSPAVRRFQLPTLNPPHAAAGLLCRRQHVRHTHTY